MSQFGKRLLAIVILGGIVLFAYLTLSGEQPDTSNLPPIPAASE